MTGYCGKCHETICICDEMNYQGAMADLHELVQACCKYLSGKSTTKAMQNFVVWNYPKDAKKHKLKEIK